MKKTIFRDNPCHHSPVPCGGEITHKKPSCSLGFLLGCSLVRPGIRQSLATCLGEALAETECLFIPLQAMFHFRLPLGEKWQLNY